MSIGENIKRLRRVHDMTQQELADKLGLSPMSVSQWENDRAVPRMGAVEQLSKIFGVSKSEIIEDKRTYNVVDLSTDTEHSSAPESADIVSLINVFDKLDSSGRNELISYGKYLMFRNNNKDA